MHAGDLQHAHVLGDGLIDTLPRGLQRATALNLLAGMQIHLSSFGTAVGMLKSGAGQRRGSSRGAGCGRRRIRPSFTQLKPLWRLLRASRRTPSAPGRTRQMLSHPDLTSWALNGRARGPCICGYGIDEASLPARGCA